MDVLLRDGDMVIGHDGSALSVSGAHELLQRAVLRLAVRRGSLPHDPAFGSYLHQLGGAGGALNEKALAACRETLAPMPDVRVRSADCQFSPDAGRLHVRVGLEAGHQNYQLEVTV